MQIVEVFAPYLHGYFDRSRVALRDHADVDHVADCDAFERDWRSILEAGGIFKIGAELDLARKHPACGAGHKKNQPDQYGHGS